jgi:hypothetical protein
LIAPTTDNQKAMHRVRSRGCSVSIVSDYGLDDMTEVQSLAGEKGFLLAYVSTPALGTTQPLIQWVPGVLFLGGKARLGCDADHSPLTSFVVKKV